MAKRANIRPFGERSSRQRKAQYIRIRNAIRRNAAELGGLFWTHDLLHGTNSWIDAYFLSSQSRTFFNVTLETAASAYREKARSTALRESYKLVPERYDFLDLLNSAVRDPQTGCYTMAFPPDEPEAAFGGLNRYEWVDQQTLKYCTEGTHPVYETVTLHRDYAFGIGLHGTLNVDYLTKETIETFIRDFQAGGERPFRSDVPLTFPDERNMGVDANVIARRL